MNSGLDYFLTEDGLPSTANGVMRNAVGLPKLSPTDVDITARNTTVKFDDGSDDESSVNGAESEVSRKGCSLSDYLCMYLQTTK